MPINGLPMLTGQLLYQIELEEDPSFKLPKNNWSICIPFLSHGMIIISDMLGVSRMTIHRCRRDFNMNDDAQQTSDHQLKIIFTELRSEIPSAGETMVMGHLHVHGYNVTHKRMHLAIHATNPINTSLRCRGNLSYR